MKEYKPMTTEAIEQINDLYDRGKTCSEIAELTGFSRSTVYNYVWRPRKRGPAEKGAKYGTITG